MALDRRGAGSGSNAAWISSDRGMIMKEALPPHTNDTRSNAGATIVLTRVFRSARSSAKPPAGSPFAAVDLIKDCYRLVLRNQDRACRQRL
jgi:hypothetical protein